MRILNISKGYDTGAWGWRLKQAFGRHTDWTFDSMYAPNGFTYMDLPFDLEWDSQLARRLYAEADVVHLHNGFSTAAAFERMQRPKPAVAHYHGTAFRQNPLAYLGKQHRRGAVGIVSTLDLWLIAPEDLTWLPSPFDLESLTRLRSGAAMDRTLLALSR